MYSNEGTVSLLKLNGFKVYAHVGGDLLSRPVVWEPEIPPGPQLI